MFKHPTKCHPNVLPLRPNGLSPKRPVTQMTCNPNVFCPTTGEASNSIITAFHDV